MRRTRLLPSCLALLAILGQALTAHALSPAPGTRPSLAEITLPAPTTYAILLQPASGARLLVADGDTLTHPRDASRLIRVEHVSSDALALRVAADRAERVGTGRPIPSLPGFIFAEAVLLSRLQLWHRTVDRVRQLGPTLVTLDGSAATVEIEVPPRAAALAAVDPPAAPAVPLQAPTQLSETVLTRVKVREVGNDKYEVGRNEFREALANVGTVLAGLGPMVVPTLSVRNGLEYRITSAAGDGVLGGEGFTVYDPKLAARAGIEVGDRILKVNDSSVEGLGSLYRIYQEIRGNASVTTVQVELERAGSRFVKLFRIR